jgi:magnesium transporter
MITANFLDALPPHPNFRFLFFSELFERRVVGEDGKKVGRVDDMVFTLKDPYPEIVGVLMEGGVGHPTVLIPWKKVRKIEPKALVVAAPDEGDTYPKFVDQAGWLLVDKHLMGRTILDTDGRRIEAVNDVQLLESEGRVVLVHVDTSLNGFLRRIGLGSLRILRDSFINWKYVQPLSIEDAVSTDRMSLSVTRKQLAELPSEDLADALEELSGTDQQALFSALDAEKAAETLLDAEPRAQRQIIANIRQERATTILSEMSIAQVADLFSVLPHSQVTELLGLLSPEQSKRVEAILSERDVTAGAVMSTEFVAMTKERKVGDALRELRTPGRDPETISYVYVVEGEKRALVGVVDLRELVLARDEAALSEIMVSPVISVEDRDLRDDVHALFAKYHYHMVPVVGAGDTLLGVIRFGDVMKPGDSQRSR